MATITLLAKDVDRKLFKNSNRISSNNI
jgi:hypothetical protein